MGFQGVSLKFLRALKRFPVVLRGAGGTHQGSRTFEGFSGSFKVLREF